MPDFVFWAYPWDLEEEGIDMALARMAGQIGVDAVSVIVAAGRVCEARPRSVFATRTTDMEAGLHFAPSRTSYLNTRIRPTPAAWMKSRNPLEKIARQAEKQGLKLRARVTICRSATLVEKHPEAACVNVLGAPSREWLCPSNPDVREYGIALLEDLTANYPLAAVEVADADFGGGDPFQQYLAEGVVPGEVERRLWSWCFCSSCRQRAGEAGIDVESVAAVLRDRLERMLRLEVVGQTSFASLLAEDDRLAAYQTMRAEAVRSFAKSIRGRSKTRLVLDWSSRSEVIGASLEFLREHTDRVLLAFPAEDTPRSQALFGDLVDQAGGAARVEVSVPCCPPRAHDGPSVVAAVHRATEAGHAAIGFFNYGLAAEPVLDWVRQAVRFAKREADK
jgi:hypothetical protein